jgi:hypothetical protein
MEIDVYHKHGAMNRPVNAGTAVAFLITAAIAISGCSDSTGPPPATTTSGVTQPTAGVPATVAQPNTTGAQPSSAHIPAKPDYPPAVAPSALEHGGTYWGVYVTVVRTDGNHQIKPEDKARIDAAEKSLRELGYQPDAGAYDLNCEQGLREQLRLDPQRDYATVRIFFANEAQAQQFVNAYQPGIVGTAKVTLYCMD